MKLYKQVKKGSPTYKTASWWADFSISGQRFRISLDTANKTEANTLAKEKEAKANEGKLTATSQSFARLTFNEAAEKYLLTRKLELAPASLKKEKQSLVKLKEYFGLTRLNRITAEQVLAYREWRAATCGPAIINMEAGTLRRILRRGKLWASLADDVKPLKEPATIGRSLSPGEKSALLEAAALKPEWETAYFAAILALNTTMRGCEIKGLRWQDVDLLNDTLAIRKGKTLASASIIPLTPDAFEVFVQLRKRAELFGAVEPSHFIFASFKPVVVFEDQKPVGSRITGFNPTVPIGSWKKAWGKLTAKAGLSGLRFHDLRHHAITELLTNPNVSVQTNKSIAGHVSQRMVDRYAHIRLEAKRSALDALTSHHETSVTAVTGNTSPATLATAPQ